MNKYDRYPGDYLRDTLDLTMAEDGAYCRLLDAYYSREQPIEDGKRFATVRATTAAERKATQSVLNRFFHLEDRDGVKVWVNRRAEKEIQAKAIRVEIARTNGRGGGRPKKNRHETEAVSEPITQEKPPGFSDGNQNPNRQKSLPPSSVQRDPTRGGGSKDFPGWSGGGAGPLPPSWDPPFESFVAVQFTKSELGEALSQFKALHCQKGTIDTETGFRGRLATWAAKLHNERLVQRERDDGRQREQDDRHAKEVNRYS